MEGGRAAGVDWNKRAQLDELAAVLDPEDEEGRKNALIHALHVAAIRRAGLGAHDKVLDFGCGTGRLMRELGPDVGSISGVDISEGMVERASANGDAHLYDGRSLPFTDGSFDAVVSAYVLQMFRSEPEIFRQLAEEIVRVLTPEGCLVMIERVEPSSPAFGLTAWRKDLRVAGLDLIRVEIARTCASRFDRAILRLGLPLTASVIRASARVHRWRGIRAPYTDTLLVAHATHR